MLENLILEFPELSYDFLIKKEYFMHEIIMRKTKLFPPASKYPLIKALAIFTKESAEDKGGL